jgi:hypothetical protein
MRVADDVNLEKVDDSRVARQSHNRTSEYLAQRRKGAKVRKKRFRTWRLGDLARGVSGSESLRARNICASRANFELITEGPIGRWAAEPAGVLRLEDC